LWFQTILQSLNSKLDLSAEEKGLLFSFSNQTRGLLNKERFLLLESPTYCFRGFLIRSGELFKVHPYKFFLSFLCFLSQSFLGFTFSFPFLFFFLFVYSFVQFSLFGVFWSSLSVLGFVKLADIMAEFSYYCCLLTITQ
jgi:hypothetical protein